MQVNVLSWLSSFFFFFLLLVFILEPETKPFSTQLDLTCVQYPGTSVTSVVKDCAVSIS